MELVNIDMVKSLETASKENHRKEVYLRLISMLDATILDVSCSDLSASEYAKSVLAKTHSVQLPNVASICVSPLFIESVGLVLGEESPVALCSVAAGFPLSHTFLEVKMLECAMAVENGADEIDVVINVGDVISGSGEIALSELKVLRDELGDDIVLKVIIESGTLQTEENIRKATNIAIGAGADFVKTSTGKNGVGATYEAVVTICEVIKEYYEETGKMVGVKVSGGVSTADKAVDYYTIISQILGEKWLTHDYLRIGSSALLDELIDKLK